MIPRHSIAFWLEHLVNFQLGLLPRTQMALLSNQARPFSYLRVVLCATILSLLGSVSAYSQIKPSPIPPPPEPPSVNKPDSPLPDFGSPEIEMRARNALKAEKKNMTKIWRGLGRLRSLPHNLSKLTKRSK